jgi:hypothetical protein
MAVNRGDRLPMIAALGAWGMARKRRPVARRRSSRIVVQQEGKKQTHVEELPDALAVRYTSPEGAAHVCALVGRLGKLRVLPAHRLIILELPDACSRLEAMRRLEQCQDEGHLEFVTPLLRDPDSHLHQILTDEITVRLTAAHNPPAHLEKKYGVTIARQNEFVPNQFIVKVPEARGLKTLEVAKKLEAAEDVEFAAPNFISEFERG